jgi:hypothetical protein
MTSDQGDQGRRWQEGYHLGLRDGLSGGMTLICDGGSEKLEMVADYWAGRQAGLQQREAAPEAGS